VLVAERTLYKYQHVSVSKKGKEKQRIISGGVGPGQGEPAKERVITSLMGGFGVGRCFIMTIPIFSTYNPSLIPLLQSLTSTSPAKSSTLDNARQCS
jgi:hypothetical protein